MVDSFMK